MTLDSPHALARRARNDSIRALYQDTRVPVREIARIAGVTERNIYALVGRLGCRPRLRLASGGGRRIVPLAAAAAMPFDDDSVQRAVQRCEHAVQEAHRLTAAARAARDKLAAARHALDDAEGHARVLALVVRAMRDLAAITDGEPGRADRRNAAQAVKPKKPRGYQWKPVRVS